MEDIKRKTTLSVMSLFFQSGYSAFLGLVANLILTIIVSPKIFGMYITVLSLISILNYFSDLGLAASLVQKKKIDDEDLKTAFTVQQILIIAVIGLGYFTTPFIEKFYALPPEGVYLYWSFLLAFFMSSLKTIPSILLERKIKFEKIVLVQIIENTVFYVTVITLALLHLGIYSFTFAVLFRAVIGLLIIYAVSFWKPQLGISQKSLKELLSFGLPFQTNSLLALFKDDAMTLFLGKILGFEALGYIGWAKKWAEALLRIIMDNISRVIFPLIARFQDDKKTIAKLIEKILYYQTIVILPSLTGLVLIMPKIVEFIPKYTKWTPALPLLYLFALSALLSSYSTPFINLFNALGKIKISFVFMTAWTIATWILTPVFIKLFGVYGFPLTLALLSSSFILVVLQAKKIISFSFIKPLYQFYISSFLMAIIVYIAIHVPLPPLFALILSVSSGTISYILINQYLFKIRIVDEIIKITKNVYE